MSSEEKNYTIEHSLGLFQEIDDDKLKAVD